MFEDGNDLNEAGLTTEDINVTHKAAFLTLMQAWDARLIAEENGQPADILAFRAEMESAFQRYKESMAVVGMIADDEQDAEYPKS